MYKTCNTFGRNWTLANSHWLYGLIATLIITVASTEPVSAHTFWLQESEQGAHLFLGDAADDARYSEDSVKEAGARGPSSEEVSVSKDYDHGHMHLVAPEAQVLWVKADYGYWIKTVRGWQEGRKSENSRVRDSAWHVQYAKLVKSYKTAQKVDLPLEIVVDSVDSRHLKGRVLRNGEPVHKVPLYLGHKKVARTDASGSFKIKKPKKNRIVISAVFEQELSNNPDADKKIITSTLTLAGNP